ncbi:GGDEF domain-containing protein [Thiohalophilus sp.]|uniref:GGDEF domain-containing protein n=1 Tax=Thiohalophilus sp. TaxID=3028392 RepID=UPI002ACDB0A8|nr:GGDEF domain-containing protein [Thiohalophilus sp.]MDZ7661679.1 GGDEF domain-containing protein [Thiohalophilus sp.]
MASGEEKQHAGDMVLNRIVDVVKETIRPLDMFGRFGGEEFLILLPDVPQDMAVKVAERIRKALEALQISYEDQTLVVTVSLGVAQWDGHSSLDELINRADNALYEAKALGRNLVQPASPAPDADQAQRDAGKA